MPGLHRTDGDYREIRRGLVESAETPPDIRDFLTNVQKQKNPWGEAKFKRDQWAKKSEVEVLTVKNNPEFEWLWFVGCGHSFDSRNQQVAVKLARLLSDIGVNYAILGREEGCCGNDVRRVGEEGLFQLLREENYQIFEKYGVEKLFATSPHCYNTFYAILGREEGCCGNDVRRLEKKGSSSF